MGNRPHANERGFTLVELLIVVAIIGILAAIAMPLYGSASQRARVAKAQADGRALATAVSAYTAHVGTFPADLDELVTSVTNAQNQAAGPFIVAVPAPPQGWSAYAYWVDPPTWRFSISAAGDGTNVTLP